MKHPFLTDKNFYKIVIFLLKFSYFLLYFKLALKIMGLSSCGIGSYKYFIFMVKKRTLCPGGFWVNFRHRFCTIVLSSNVISQITLNENRFVASIRKMKSSFNEAKKREVLRFIKWPLLTKP